MADEKVKKSLAAKLAEVMAVVKRIPKRGVNQFHGYAYATEADLADAVRDELSQRNVILVPDVLDVQMTDATPTKAGRPQFLTMLKVKWTFKDGDSAEEISFHIPGWGIDGEDKGGYKALTGSEKYALMKFFLVPTGDDPERDEREPERSKPSQGQNRPAGPPQAQQRAVAPVVASAEDFTKYPAPEYVGNEMSCTVTQARKAPLKGGKGEYVQVGIANRKTLVCFRPDLFKDLLAITKPTPAVLKFKLSGKGNFPDEVTEIVTINGKQPEMVRLGIGDAETGPIPF